MTLAILGVLCIGMGLLTPLGLVLGLIWLGNLMEPKP